MKTSTNEEAVSPVIGVILMIAITVILAAVIAAFVFSMSGNMSNTNTQKIIAVSVQQSAADKITVTFLGGQDAKNLQYAMINVTDDDGNFIDTDNLGNAVGSSVTVTSSKISKDNHVIVVGHFTDGSEQVISDTYV